MPPQPTMLKETTGGQFRVYRASVRLRSIRYIDLLSGSYNGTYPAENILDLNPEALNPKP